MHTTEMNRLRESYALLGPRLDRVAEAFYDRLFGQHPGLRKMFPADMTRQRGHMAATIALVCKNVHNLDALEEPLMLLGQQHAKIGARPEHYPVVRDTMIAAMAEVVGEAWTPELSAGWHAALSRVSSIMLRGAVRDALETAERLASEERTA